MYCNFRKDYPYFVLDPEGNGVLYFETIEERDEFAAKCVQDHLDDEGMWNEEVTNVVAGVITHSAQEIDRVDRPSEVDDEGCDEEGNYWPDDTEYKCNYRLLPVEACGAERYKMTGQLDPHAALATEPLVMRGVELSGEYFADVNLLSDVIAEDTQAKTEAAVIIKEMCQCFGMPLPEETMKRLGA